MPASEASFSQWLWENEFKPMVEQGVAWWFKPPTQARRGIPDWIGCINGRFVSLELKKEKASKDKSREALQAYIAQQLTKAGCVLALTRVTKTSWIQNDREKVMSLLKEERLPKL
jgi:hypothetical protein